MVKRRLVNICLRKHEIGISPEANMNYQRGFTISEATHVTVANFAISQRVC